MRNSVVKAKCNSTLMQMMHCANNDRVDDGSLNNKNTTDQILNINQ